MKTTITKGALKWNGPSRIWFSNRNPLRYFSGVDFYGFLDGLLEKVLEAGAKADAFTPPRPYSKPFLFATHRAFREVQNSVVEALQNLPNESGITSEEKTHRELLLRRLMDGIAYAMIADATIARKVKKHDCPPLGGVRKGV
jgi:hypothetical protein